MQETITNTPPMITIRDYQEQDATEVGLMIKNTYSQYNLAYLHPEEVGAFLGPFSFAGDGDPEHTAEIGRMIRSQFVYVAEDNGKIVGVLRGRVGRLGSLFVAGSYHKRGAGRMLVERFERQILNRGGGVIRVASSLYAVPFYLKMGYKRSTGVRKSWSFDGYGFPIQPMKKVLKS